MAGVLLCGALCVLIAFCFAELSSMYDRSGGPYVYARDAFGSVAGFAVGWLGMSTGVLGLAAVALGFGTALQRFASVPRAPAACVLILALGVINWIGVKAGGRTSTALSVLKIAPLLALALVGVVKAAPHARVSLEPHGLLSAAFLSVFMMSGFEYAAVPAGEVREARRTVPLAIVGSIAGASLLYALLQVTALGALGALPGGAAQAEQPLPDVAAALVGGWGAQVIGLTAVISMVGFCAGVALVAPRYFMAMADDRYLPARLRQVRPAVVVSTLLACAFSVLLGYASLVDVSNVVILSGYAFTCLACFVLRFRRPDQPRRIRLPLAVPAIAFAAAVALLISAQPQLSQWKFSGALLCVGFLAWAATALVESRP